MDFWWYIIVSFFAAYEWSVSTPTEYTKWSTGEPNNHGGDEDCTFV
jgi:hypothetical protein